MMTMHPKSGGTIQLPDAHELNRPLYAYKQLPGEMRLLRREVFGNTDALLQELSRFGDMPLTEDQVNQLARSYYLHDDIRQMLQANAVGKPGCDVHQWYASWETRTFAEYVKRLEMQIS